MYKSKSISKYLDDLAARLPAPGGGSAAALSGAMGAALISMVLNFTIGKPKYAKYEKELKKALNDSEKFRKEFLNLVDKDVVAYKSKNVKYALCIPVRVAQNSFEAIKLCPAILNKSNAYLVSDIAVAAVLLEAAFASSYFNIEINLKILKDKKLSGSLRKDFAKKEKVVKKIKMKMEEEIGKIIRG